MSISAVTLTFSCSATTEALISQQLYRPHPQPKGKNTSSANPRSIVDCVYAKVEKKLALFCDQESWGSGF
jgi:hypothetical protein